MVVSYAVRWGPGILAMPVTVVRLRLTGCPPSIMPPLHIGMDYIIIVSQEPPVLDWAASSGQPLMVSSLLPAVALHSRADPRPPWYALLRVALPGIGWVRGCGPHVWGHYRSLHCIFLDGLLDSG